MGSQKETRVSEQSPRVFEVLKEASSRGLLGAKGKPQGGRLYENLVEEAKRVSGIENTTQLLNYALAKVAVEDDFGQKLLARKGRVPRGTFSDNGI